MKANFTTARLVMMFVFGAMMTACTTNEDDMPTTDAKVYSIEVAAESQQKDRDTTGNGNEPIITKPRD